jgi:hypothetical protein
MYLEHPGRSEYDLAELQHACNASRQGSILSYTLSKQRTKALLIILHAFEITNFLIARPKKTPTK